MIYFLEHSYPKTLLALALYIHQPGFPTALQWFLFQQCYPNAWNIPENLPEHSSHINVFHSVVATFYALSDLCGAGGMYQEHIRSNMKWKGRPRHDTVFITVSDDADIKNGMLIARVLLFLFFFILWSYTLRSDSVCIDELVHASFGPMRQGNGCMGS